MEKSLQRQINMLRVGFMILSSLFIILIFSAFQSEDNNTKFEEIDVERINIIEKDGTLKLALFNSERLTRGIAKRQGEGSISGMLFYNEEGHEAGGLVFNGKKISGGQMSESGLLFDQYRQDQTIALEHGEYKDSVRAEYSDGLRIVSRPDRSDVRDEYDFYKFLRSFSGTGAEKDSLIRKYADEKKYAAKRFFAGNKRGTEDGVYYDNTGVFIYNKYGKQAIRLFVDNDNKPHLEVFDADDKSVVYEWVLRKK